jgi:hypothetical protein
MAVGFVRSATHLELRNVSQIGQVGYPYYDTPRVMQTARQTFAVLAVICLAMTGVSAWIAFREPATILLAPIFLLSSPLYFQHSWLYLNVDIVGATFAMVTVTACLAALQRPSIRGSAIVPGVFAGLAAASKYSLAVVVVAVFAGIALYVPRARVVGAWLAALGVMIAAFLVAVPYSVIDIPGFLNGVGYEAFHYASGHAGFAADPGWPQVLFYSEHFVREFGYVAAILAVIGLVRFPIDSWRRAAVLTAFPAALFWLLVSQRVHFTRNALAIELFLAMFAAYALVRLHGWIVATARRRGWAPEKVPVPALAGALLVIGSVPFWQFADRFRDHTDSRTLASRWVREQLPASWAVVVPSELGFDRRGLEGEGRHVKVVSLRSVDSPGALQGLLSDVPSPAVLLVPRWGADRRSPGQSQADALNAALPRRPVSRRFGSRDVLVNYWCPTAWGDPAFSIVAVK